MSEDTAVFLASMKRLRAAMDDFNCQVAAIDGAGMRLGALCEETAAVAPSMRELTVVARALRSFSATLGEALPCFLAAADSIARDMRSLELGNRKGIH